MTARAVDPPLILFVCTANQCRSPLAMALARAAVPASAARIASAGLLPGGERMPEAGLSAARRLGLDLTGHVSSQVDAETARDADLILTMTRAQARELVAEYPELWPRVFTLKAFARWVAEHEPSAEGLSRRWLEREASDRPRHELLGAAPSDDIADPMGQNAEVWRIVTAELADAINAIAPRLAAAAPTRRTAPGARGSRTRSSSRAPGPRS